MSAHRHEIRIRYGEVDVQGPAFNAHDLTYVDEACDAWFTAVVTYVAVAPGTTEPTPVPGTVRSALS